MSRPRVITGADDRGRPKAVWAPADTAAQPYGHMEPAFAGTIERRRATPEELAAARAREAAPDHLTSDNARTLPFGAMTTPPSPATAQRMQVSRQRGADRHVEITAARRATERPLALAQVDTAPPEPTPEEETVAFPTEPPPEYSDPVPSEAPAGDVALDRLSMAAEKARLAWDEKAAADTAWNIAREALARAYADVEWLVEPMPAPPDDDHVHQILTVPLGPSMTDIVNGAESFAQAAIAEARASVALDGETQVVESAPAPADPTRPVSTDRRTARVNGGLTLHEQRILDAVLANDGARKPVAEKLKTSDANIVATLERIGKRGLLPIALIPKLPARFAKYQGV